MSWGEVFKINKNMKRALNEQLRDLKFQEIKIITSSGTYTPTKTGLYKVICVGAGGDGKYATTAGRYGGSGGGGGGVAISTLNLSSSGSYTVTVSSTASFVYSDEITLTATAGGMGDGYSYGGSGGTASGGDNNYSGTSGSYVNETTFQAPPAGSVGVAISGLTRSPATYVSTLTYTYSSTTTTYIVNFIYGDSILNYGGGGTGAAGGSGNAGSYTSYATAGKPAAVLIVPLELEE